MKLTIRQIKGSAEPLKELMTYKFPAVVALRLSLASKALDAPIKSANETYGKLLQQYGKVDANNPSQFEILDREAFIQEVKNLEDTEVEVSLEKIPFGLIASYDVKPIHLLALDWLFATEGL